MQSFGKALVDLYKHEFCITESTPPPPPDPGDGVNRSKFNMLFQRPDIWYNEVVNSFWRSSLNWANFVVISMHFRVFLMSRCNISSKTVRAAITCDG